MDTDVYSKELLTATGASELAFPRATYDRRVSSVRAAMAEASLDVLLVTDMSDLNYLTGYDTLGSTFMPA